jgi:predicted SnoaL-like aldol condensation-catalyzing enzyme
LKIASFSSEGDHVFLYGWHWASNKMMTIIFKTIDIFKVGNGNLLEHYDVIEGGAIL